MKIKIEQPNSYYTAKTPYISNIQNFYVEGHLVFPETPIEKERSKN